MAFDLFLLIHRSHTLITEREGEIRPPMRSYQDCAHKKRRERRCWPVSKNWLLAQSFDQHALSIPEWSLLGQKKTSLIGRVKKWERRGGIMMASLRGSECLHFTYTPLPCLSDERAGVKWRWKGKWPFAWKERWRPCWALNGHSKDGHRDRRIRMRLLWGMELRAEENRSPPP